jgi:hypothetical protein
VNDRRGNVIENKGSALSNPEISGNLIENKGSYALMAGMLLKGKGISCSSQVVGGGEAQPTFDLRLLTVDCLYNIPERGLRVYTLGYDAIPELKSRRNQLNQEGSP